MQKANRRVDVVLEASELGSMREPYEMATKSCMQNMVHIRKKKHLFHDQKEFSASRAPAEGPSRTLIRFCLYFVLDLNGSPDFFNRD